MKKSFLTWTMVFIGLLAGVNTMRAINISGMTDEQAETLGFWARLTAKPATTTNGSGLVFVVDEDHYEFDPEAGDYASTHSADGWSDVYLQTSLIDADVHFRAYAKANPGSYFTGWSFTDGYTDLGTEAQLNTKVTPSSTKAHSNIKEYNVYAAFDQVKLVSSEFVSGSNTTVDDGEGNWTCTQTIKFRAETPGVWALSSGDDAQHFKRPVVAKKAGTNGSWSIGDAEWITSGVGQNFTAFGEYAELSVPVTFVAPDDNAAEYGAELVLETYAGVKMKVYLSARTTGGSEEAIRYNSSKVQQEAGSLATLLSRAASGDIIKLNGNYSNEVDLNKNITFDLNGFVLSNTLKVSGNNVTIAYSPYGGSATALNVTGGKAILNGGTFGTLTIGANGTVEQNGAIITGAATNSGSLTTTDGKFQSGLTSSKTLIVNGGTFTGATAINVTGGTAQIKKGTIAGTTYGVQSAGTTTIEKLAVISGNTMALNRIGGTLTVNNGKFADPNNFATGDIVFKSAYFQTNSTEASVICGKQVWRNTAGAEARAGYAFFVGDQDAAQAANVSVCRIGQASYSSLEDALAYANNNLSQDVVIIMENDYVLEAGYYTLPANATLIVPMSNEQETANQIVPRKTGAIATPKSFRKLIFADGVNMSVMGTIEVTCTQYGAGEEMGIPAGNYGHLIMKPGSRMTINNGGELRAWGFVSGDGTKDGAGNYLSGEIDARRGGTVREMFQMGDWKGGDISFSIAMEVPGKTTWRDLAHLFPVYTYFIQNVESPVKYHPGSSLICATSVNVAGNINAYANDIKVVGVKGEAAMFLMDEMADADNTWVRKWYDAKNDKQVYEVNSGAQLGSLVIELGEVPGAMFGGSGTLNLELDSRKFVLPLTNNFKIHLLSGNMQFTQSTSCLPGMEVEIDKESEIAIINQDREGVVEGALYLYDADQWSFQNTQAKGYVGNSGAFGAIVRYSPTWDLGTNGAQKYPNVRDISSPAAIGDAILNVHGTFRMGENCAVYTTWSKNMETLVLDDSESASGGAKIISSNEDAGTFIFDADAPAAFQGLIYDFSDPENPQVVGFHPDVLVNYDHNDYGLGTQYPIQIGTVLGGTERVFGFEFCTSAKLTNGDGTFAETQGMTAGTSYCYMDGKWTNMSVAPENECFMKDNYGTFYAKPAEYVAVVASVVGGKVVGNDDHTYSDAAGAGRLFILMDDCQWWEVEKKDNLYHCIHPNNDTYYYWDDSNANPNKHHWAEQRFTITWKNWDGEEIKSYTYDENTGEPQEVEYSVTYGTMAEYLGSNPTRPANIDYTYDFTGWSPALGRVTSDVTYTATYNEQPRKYTIIFQNEGGVEIERQFLKHNDVPVCENTPTKVGHTLQWSPAISAVIGDATYTATWLEEPPTEYEIRFVDYDGYELQKSNVSVGELPEYTGSTPTKKNTDQASNKEFTYVFANWSPNITKVTEAMTYTAVYREVPKEYTITFNNEDNSTIETKKYQYGETPSCSDLPSKPATAEYTYKLVWTPQIQTVMDDATYTATFPGTKNKYSVTLKSNPSGACTLSGAGIYEYNTSATAVTISLIANGGYTFTGWSDGQGGINTTRQMAITGDVNLVANFDVEDPDVTITWKSEDGLTTLVEVGQKSGTATTYTGATPTKEAANGYTFTFDGWTTAANGAGTYYRNGMTPKATANATYYAHFAASAIPNLEVSGVTVLTEPVEYQDLIITSNGTTSGQLMGVDKLTLKGNAYFDYAVNAQARKWYQVAVPWEVDVNTGVFVNGKRVSYSNMDIIYYDGARRAAEGPNKCWKDVKDNGGIMIPGRLYLIALSFDAPVIRFKANDKNHLLTTNTEVSAYPESTDNNDKDAGWNGVANPALFQAYLNATGTSDLVIGQVYNPNGGYNQVVLNTTKLTVGQGAFIQVSESKSSIVVKEGADYASSAPTAAPRRNTLNDNEIINYEVRIAPINKEYTDRVFIQTNADKDEDRYMVGKDLVKMGVSSSVAQMWINRYDAKLCLNTMAPEEENAEYPLSIFVPQTGEYTIGIFRTAEEQQAELYLTLDGDAIWNLSKNSYTMDIEQGTISRYGLRIHVKKTPQVATSIDEAIVDAKSEVATKVLIDNHVFIIRGDKVYTINGQLVK